MAIPLSPEVKQLIKRELRAPEHAHARRFAAIPKNGSR
jgi:hypothetical protein